MKRGLLLFTILTIISISLASAGILDGLTDSFNNESLLFFSVLAIIFILFFLALSKVKTFKTNRPAAGVISLAVSFLVMYGLNKMNFSLQDFFLSAGFSDELIAVITPLIVLGVLLLLIIKTKFLTFLILGISFVLVGLLDLVYASDFLIILGGILIVIYFLYFIKTFPERKREKIAKKRLSSVVKNIANYN